MRKCPNCKTVYGTSGGKPGTYKFCPMCGAELVYARGRRVFLTREEWEEFNRWEHYIPWNEDVRMDVEDESF